MSEKMNSTRKTNKQNQEIWYCGKGFYKWNAKFSRWEWLQKTNSPVKKEGLYKKFDETMIH
jgi:hypothetical protein